MGGNSFHLGAVYWPALFKDIYINWTSIIHDITFKSSTDSVTELMHVLNLASSVSCFSVLHSWTFVSLNFSFNVISSAFYPNRVVKLTHPAIDSIWEEKINMGREALVLAAVWRLEKK